MTYRKIGPAPVFIREHSAHSRRALESIETWGGLHTEILKKPIRWQDGYVIPPRKPVSLVVELNEAVALAHPYTGNAPHLEMRPTPVV